MLTNEQKRDLMLNGKRTCKCGCTMEVWEVDKRDTVKWMCCECMKKEMVDSKGTVTEIF